MELSTSEFNSLMQDIDRMMMFVRTLAGIKAGFAQKFRDIHGLVSDRDKVVAQIEREIADAQKRHGEQEAEARREMATLRADLDSMSERRDKEVAKIDAEMAQYRQKLESEISDSLMAQRRELSALRGQQTKATNEYNATVQALETQIERLREQAALLDERMGAVRQAVGG